MARKSTMHKVPDDLRNEVNARLRKELYANQQGVRQWLADQGYDISKSSFNRYVVALKANDGNRGRSTLGLIARDADANGLTRADEILMELGRLRVREAELLDELREITGRG